MILILNGLKWLEENLPEVWKVEIGHPAPVYGNDRYSNAYSA
jgi:hypothetical protein